MNFLLINYEYPPIGGGAGNATMFIARALHGLGHRVTVLTAAFAEHSGVGSDGGVTVHRLRAARRRADGASQREMLSFVFAALRAAPQIASGAGIGAVIVFFSIPCGPIALRLHRAMGLPYVVSLRGGDVPGFVPEIGWQHRLLTSARRSVLRSARAIVANDVGLARLSAAADPFKVVVIPNGVDCQFFAPRAEIGPDGGPTRILFAGRMHRQKNLPFFLTQMGRLHAGAPNGWLLDLVGDGEERAAVEKCVRRLNLADITTLHGWQKDKSRLRELYQRAHVVVNPSLYEGMPNVVLEAMACGLPVVASEVPGNESLVRSGETGYLYEPGDGDALCAALREVRASPAMARGLGLNGRRTVEARYSWSHVARRYAALFEPATSPVSSPG